MYYEDTNTKQFNKKDLEAFMDSRGLRNEKDPAWCWRRTVLRSINSIYLLDKAKQMNKIAANLYQGSSTTKSSLAFLRELTALIHPLLEISIDSWDLRFTAFTIFSIRYPSSPTTLRASQLISETG